MHGRELLTPEEVADYLRVNPHTAYRLLRSGRLPGAKIGHQWRVRKADLDAYLDRRVGAAPITPETRVPAAVGATGQ